MACCWPRKCSCGICGFSGESRSSAWCPRPSNGCSGDGCRRPGFLKRRGERHFDTDRGDAALLGAMAKMKPKEVLPRTLLAIRRGESTCDTETACAAFWGCGASRMMKPTIPLPRTLFVNRSGNGLRANLRRAWIDRASIRVPLCAATQMALRLGLAGMEAGRETRGGGMGSGPAQSGQGIYRGLGKIQRGNHPGVGGAAGDAATRPCGAGDCVDTRV